MSIQNNNVNFQANCTMITRSVNKKPLQESFKIYKLNKQDVEFAKEYISKLPDKGYTVNKENDITDFFYKFINETKEKVRHRHNFYIGVKNDKTFSGCFSISQDKNPVLWIKDLVVAHNKDIFSSDSMFKFILARAIKSPIQPIYGVNKSIDTLAVGKDLIHVDELMSKSKKIDKKYKDIIFYKTKRPDAINVDLKELVK